MDFTINLNIGEAVGLSREINKFLGDNIVSIQTSLATEEILANIIAINESLGTIEYILKRLMRK